MSASLAVQTLARAVLEGIEGVTGIHDGVPPGAPGPHIVIGQDIVTDWSSASFTGHEHRIAVSVWDAGPGTTRAKALAGSVEAALAGLAGDGGGHRIVSSRFVRSLVLTDAEAWTQAITEFRVRTVTLPVSS